MQPVLFSKHLHIWTLRGLGSCSQTIRDSRRGLFRLDLAATLFIRRYCGWGEDGLLASNRRHTLGKHLPVSCDPTSATPPCLGQSGVGHFDPGDEDRGTMVRRCFSLVEGRRDTDEERAAVVSP